MKTNCWLILGTMLATTAVAQVNTNKLPEIPAPAITPAAPAAPIMAPSDANAVAKTNAPAKKAAKSKKKAPKKAKANVKLAEKKSSEKAEKTSELALGPVTLTPGSATVAAEHANLRGQAGLNGEVVGHLKKGDTVTVISEITLDKPKAGEPAQWAKISLPADTKVWINSKFVDATNKVVTAKKLNLRGGPGENYSVLGVIEKGAAVNSVKTKDDWMQIDPPANAFAFVAASLLKQEGGIVDTNVPVLAAVENSNPHANNVPAPVTPPAPEPVPAVQPAPVMITPPPALPPTTTTVADAPVIAPPAATPPAPEPAVAPVAPAVPPANLALSVPATPAPTLIPDDSDTEIDTNLPPRIVTHEGSVRHSVSPVAPTYYELYDPADDKAIDYLFTSSTNLNLTRYAGLHITVTGEESMDVRWKDTPVLTIQQIRVLAAPAPKKFGAASGSNK